MPEGCVSLQVPSQDFSCRGEFVTDEAEPEEPSAHGIFGVFVLLRFGAGRLDRLGHLAECEAKLNVTLKLPCMKSALPLGGGVVELEKPELDGALGKGGVEVQHVVSAVIVVGVACSVVPFVPNVGKCSHRTGLSLVQAAQEVWIDHLAVLSHPAAIQAKGLG